ncbi:MAG TPA: nickel pincer cofactor biosynthesis protein LarB [Candidatus Nitrosotalea sp.]|nr:nickel pincer cofactor biosynthesis protein LarB [Candidatus Nitrosotalea sp.]
MKAVLQRLLAGELSLQEAEHELRRIELEDLGGDARLDLGRTSRRGLPEVVLASGKTPAEAARLGASLAREQGLGLVSRIDPEHAAALQAEAEQSGLELVIRRRSARLSRPGFLPPERAGRIGILTAGTSDLDAAEEAAMVVQAVGMQARVEADLGVAGLHRLFVPLAELVAWGAQVLIVAAGMDGVLPGVVAGLVPLPVIGLPVSTGYGAGGAGEAALLTMLQSCATGLLVVNIDNGVGAGAAAVLIAGAAETASPTVRGSRRPRSEAPARRPRPGSPSD